MKKQLRPEQRVEMLAEMEKGVPTRTLAKRYGINRNQVLREAGIYNVSERATSFGVIYKAKHGRVEVISKPEAVE